MPRLDASPFISAQHLLPTATTLLIEYYPPGMYESSVPQPMVETAATKATGQVPACPTRRTEITWTAVHLRSLHQQARLPRLVLPPYHEGQVRHTRVLSLAHGLLRPCPLPGDGNQMASVTRVEDVASMLASVVGKVLFRLLLLAHIVFLPPPTTRPRSPPPAFPPPQQAG
eukprot:752496-Hanusia_phi.AAC.2